MRLFLSISLALLFLTQVNAQDIRAVLIGGINMAQVDGDNIAGFNKFGLNVGGGAHWFFNDKFSLNFEILFAQKGSSSVPVAGVVITPTKFKLNYAEVPILFNYHDKGKVSFGAGLGIGTLVKEEISINGSPLQSSLARQDITILLDGTVKLTEKLSFNLRYGYSIFSIGEYQRRNLFNNLFSVRLAYMLTSIKN